MTIDKVLAKEPIHIKGLIYSMLLVFSYDLLSFYDIVQSRPLYGFFLRVIMILFLVLYLYRVKPTNIISKEILKIKFIFGLYFVYNLILLLLGFIFCEKDFLKVSLLSSAPNFILPLFLFVFSDERITYSFIRLLVKYILPIGFVVYFVNYTNYDDENVYISRVFYSITWIALIGSFINRSSVILVFILSLSLIIVSYRFSARAFLVHSIACIVFPLMSLFIRKSWLHILKACVIIGTIAFFTYTIINEVLSYNRNIDDISLDTRTGLLHEIHTHLMKHDAVLWGTTPGIGYTTDLRYVIFHDMETGENDDSAWELLRYGRQSSESQFLNLYHWGGVINIILISLLFWDILSVSIKKKHNSVSITLWMYVLFRFAFMYIDGPQSYTEQFIMLWLSMALILNERFCSLDTDNIRRLILDEK